MDILELNSLSFFNERPEERIISVFHEFLHKAGLYHSSKSYKTEVYNIEDDIISKRWWIGFRNYAVNLKNLGYNLRLWSGKDLERN